MQTNPAERGAAALEAALIVFPCMFLLAGFFALSQGLFSIAVTTNDAVYSNLVHNLWLPASSNAPVDQLTVGHRQEVAATVGVSPGDRAGFAFANIVAGEAHRRGDAFGLAPTSAGAYSQTSVEVRQVTQPGTSSLPSSDYRINTVVRRFFPLFTDAVVRSSAITYLPRTQPSRLGYIDTARRVKFSPTKTHELPLPSGRP